MKTALLLLSAAFLLPQALLAQDLRKEEVQAFIVKEYRFVEGENSGDPDIGHSLCGTRCNALSVDYLNYTMPGGWRVIKVASDRELTVDLGNPFMEGECVCLVDEYVVKFNELNKSVNSNIPKR